MRPRLGFRLGDLYADARAIRTLVDQADQPVVVCAHSYSAAPASQGLAGAADVKRIVYLSGFLLDVGKSMLSAAGGTYPPPWIVNEEAGTVRCRDPEAVLYGDLAPEAARQAATGLGPQSLSSFGSR
jgi:hypothetical protein